MELRAFVLQSFLVGIGVFTPVALAQSSHHCPLLENYIASHTGSCTVDYNCSALSCASVGFSVNRCDDPVTVDVSVESGGSEVFEYSFNRSEFVEARDMSVTTIMARNASHLELEIYKINNTEEGSPAPLIGPVLIALNPRQCLCHSLDAIARDTNLNVGPSSTIAYNCSNSNCSFVICNTHGSSLQSVVMSVNSCDSPPSLALSMTVSGNVHSSLINQTQVVYLDGLGVLVLVSIWHFNYSMDVEIIARVGFFEHVILARHKIILDRTNCGPPKPLSNITETPTSVLPTDSLTSATPLPPSSDMCAALRSIAMVDGNICRTNSQCNALECELFGSRIEVSVLPCQTPAGVRVVVYNSNNRAVFNQTFHNGSHSIHPGGLPFTLLVTVEQMGENAIDVQVSARAPLGIEYQLIPETRIPLDKSSCSIPHPTEAPSSTCEAMEGIRQSLATGFFPLVCSFPQKHNCTALLCPLGFLGDQLFIHLLRCAHPPAIEVKISDGRQNALFDHVYNHSEVVPLNASAVGFNDSALNVTLDELCSNRIGFELVILSGKEDFPLFPYTIIPVNTTGCGSEGSAVMCPTSTVSGPSSTSSSSSSSSTSPTKTQSSTSSTSPTKTQSSSPSTSPTKSPSPSLSPPPSPPMFSSSCDAMQNITHQMQNFLNSSFLTVDCERQGCNSVKCSSTLFDLSITLHCSGTKGFEVTYMNKTTGSSQSKLFSKSGTWKDQNVTVVKIADTSSGVIFGVAIPPMIQYTEVPFDADACPGSSSASSEGANVVVITAAVVSTVVLVVVAVVVVVGIIVVVMVKRRKGGYHFHRMKFSEVEDEDED